MGKKKHSVNMLFTILLLGIFALAAIFVAVMGAKVFANSADKMQANFDTRTSIVYLSEKIRTCPGDRYDVRMIGDASALVLSETIDGTLYESWIFIADGQLCEATVISGDTVVPGTAQRIMPLAFFDAKLENGGVEITVTTNNGDTSTTFISGRTKR
jgi:hypothetical protein